MVHREFFQVKARLQQLNSYVGISTAPAADA
jgi:hypothetical protein